MSANSSSGPEYHIVMQPPPGDIVAPNGFPANPFPSGAPQTFLDAMSIRVRVFCEEQHCAIEPELDPDDPKSWSWVAYDFSASLSQTPVSTIRIVPPLPQPEAHPNGFLDPDEEPYVKLTRVATVAGARGRGLSRRLMDEAFAYLARHPDLVGGPKWKGLVLTHAQVAVEKMYARFGFVTDERLGRWDEEGIEHLGMWRRLDVSSATTTTSTM